MRRVTAWQRHWDPNSISGRCWYSILIRAPSKSTMGQLGRQFINKRATVLSFFVACRFGVDIAMGILSIGAEKVSKRMRVAKPEQWL